MAFSWGARFERPGAGMRRHSAGVGAACTRRRLRLAPARAVIDFHFAHALEDRRPEIAEHHEGLAGSMTFLLSISQTTASSTSVPVPPLQAT